MRLKILIPVLACGLAAIGTAIFLARPAPSSEPMPAAVAMPESPALASQNPLPAQPVQPPRRWQQEPRPAPPTDEEKAKSTQAEEEAVQIRIHELNDLAMSGDPKSLRAILHELSNPDPRLRWAAADAAAQFESQEAIPALKDALAQAADVDEMTHLQQTINFLGNVTPQAAGAAQANPP